VDGARVPLLQEHNDTVPADDPDDSASRLSVTLKEEQTVEKIYSLPALPSPLPSEMPSSFWTSLHFGKPDSRVSPEDARLCLALIERRLAEGHSSGGPIKRDPGVNTEAAQSLPTTVGALHELIYQLYDFSGWFAFQQLYHEAAGLQPKRHKRVDATNVIPNGDAKPVNCDAIEPGLAAAIVQAPSRVMRWMLAPPREPPPWRTSPPPPGIDDGSWCG
jgi:hypothetical protein